MCTSHLCRHTGPRLKLFVLAICRYVVPNGGPDVCLQYCYGLLYGTVAD